MTTVLKSKNQKIKKLIFWYVYSRSGGTLLSKLFSTNTSLCQLSEIGINLGISPSHSLESSSEAIKQQAFEWFSLNVQGKDFESSILNFCEVCENNSRIPMIRNWSHEAFNVISGIQPKNFLYTLPECMPLEISSFALTRNAIDVFLSQKQPLNEFAYKYRMYAESLSRLNIRLFQYEDLCKNPSAVMSQIYKHIGLNLECDLDNFAKQQTTGDSQLAFTSRGIRKKNKISLPRRRRYARPDKIESNRDLIVANHLLGYQTFFNDLPRQNLIEFCSEKTLKLISKLCS